MKAELINPVLSSAINVLQTMAQVVPEPGRPSLKQNSQSMGVVTGYITLEGKQANGSLAVTFPRAVILDIYQRMLMEKKSQVDDEVVNLVGEITNMVVGGAKQGFESSGLDFGLTLPEMIQGEAHDINHAVDDPVMLMPLNIESGSIYLEFCLKVN